MFFVLLGLCLGLGLLSINALQIHQRVRDMFGEPATDLDLWQQITYETILYLHKGQLLTQLDYPQKSIIFSIAPNENVSQILIRLQKSNLITDTNSLRIYLQYSGLDKQILSGDHQIDPPLSPLKIAQALTMQTNMLIHYTILPGWRNEEIAESLHASGMIANPQDFLQASQQPLQMYLPEIAPNEKASTEGFLFPDTYSILHQENSAELIHLFINHFQEQLTYQLMKDIQSQGLTVYQAVILASIVQRETIIKDEMPLIASVYLNRLHADMKLDSDPTVQYALGYNPTQKTWWTNPLSEKDLQFDSPYNTYLYKGLPPSPICNPSLDALLAVAQPAQSDFFYFRAACDQSGR
ncbi:MAG: endolytic transglycosylase MltG, partial [Anaerolineales bacterium]